MAIQDCSLHSKTPAIFLKSKGNKPLSLDEITDLIHKDDDDCVNDLLQTIRDTMNATHSGLHIQNVGRLHTNCFIIKGLLIGKDFTRKDEIMQTFKELEIYNDVDIVSKLN